MKNKHPKKEKQPKTMPIRRKEEVPDSNDHRIDEDFPGYPHHPANEKAINPKKKEDRINADVDAERHVGSAGAFEATEMGGDE